MCGAFKVSFIEQIVKFRFEKANASDRINTRLETIAFNGILST